MFQHGVLVFQNEEIFILLDKLDESDKLPSSVVVRVADGNLDSILGQSLSIFGKTYIV